jgi:uncharacterized caspase-like protein
MSFRKNFSLIFLTASLLASPIRAAHADEGAYGVFTGEIMDSLCAKDGSHDKMMSEMKSMGREKQSCTQKCVQLGGKYVLFDSAKKMVYRLDDQDKAEPFAGQQVRVKGTLEKNKIKIRSIEPIG